MSRNQRNTCAWMSLFEPVLFSFGDCDRRCHHFEPTSQARFLRFSETSSCVSPYRGRHRPATSLDPWTLSLATSARFRHSNIANHCCRIPLEIWVVSDQASAFHFVDIMDFWSAAPDTSSGEWELGASTPISSSLRSSMGHRNPE